MKTVTRAMMEEIKNVFGLAFSRLMVFMSNSLNQPSFMGVVKSFYAKDNWTKVSPYLN